MATQPAAQTRSRSRSTAVLLWIVILVFVAMNVRVFVPMMRAGSREANDFAIFYTGGRMLRVGLRHQLYELGTQAQFQTTYYQHKSLPYNHLAYELLIFLPFSGLTYAGQYFCWLAVNLVIVIAAAVSLSRHLDHPLLHSWPLVLGIAFAFPPVFVCLTQGQDALLLVLLYVLAYSCLKRRRDFLAGLLLSLGLFKFQLVLPALVVMLARKYWSFVRGFIAGSAAVVAVSIAITGWAGFLKYVALLRLLAHNPELGYIRPVLMPNLRGLFAVLLHARPAGEAVVLLLSAVSLGIAIWAMAPPSIRDRRIDVGFAVMVASVILASYHLYSHDLSVAMIPILIAANFLPRGKAELFFWMAVLVLFDLPIYLLAIDHAALGLLCVCVLSLFVALILIIRDQQRLLATAA